MVRSSRSLCVVVVLAVSLHMLVVALATACSTTNVIARRVERTEVHLIEPALLPEVGFGARERWPMWDEVTIVLAQGAPEVFGKGSVGRFDGTVVVTVSWGDHIRASFPIEEVVHVRVSRTKEEYR